MSTNASTEGRTGPVTRAAASEKNLSQAYNFSFRLVTVPPTTRPLQWRTIVPSRLLGISDEERESILKARLEALRAPTPWIRLEDLDEGEFFADHLYPVKRYAKGRFHPGVYTMNTTPEIDAAARRIVATPEVSQAFERIDETVEIDEHNEERIVDAILELSNSVRKHFNVEQSEYGRFFRKHEWTVEDYTREQHDDYESGTANIFVQGSKQPTSSSAHDMKAQYWSNLLSFIRVGSQDWFDWLDRTILWCLWYTGEIFHHHAFTSHMHFVTWSGHFVRLWYVNADMYGCSQIFDTRAPNDQIEIVKILILLSVEDHSTLLDGHWDLGAQTCFGIQGVSHPDPVQVERRMQPLKLRPGPFRSGTAVFADEDGDSEERVLVVKASWRDDRLVWRELAVLRDMQANLKMPNAPIPIGLARAPTGFQKTTAEMATPGSAFKIPARTASVLVTKQRLGRHISPYDPLSVVLHIHLQLVEQLLLLAKGGYHFRDVNDGNVRLLRGTLKTLLLIDYANVSKSSERGRQPGKPDTIATIDRAKDDIRASATKFAPTCYASAERAIRHWKSAVSVIVYDSRHKPQEALDKTYNDRLQLVLAEIREHLPKLHKAQREVNVYSHRYLDDLEASLYLLLWNTAPKRGMHRRGESTLEKDLLTDKASLWSERLFWISALRDYCSKPEPQFLELMENLRKTIKDARQRLTAYLSDAFDRKVSVEDLEERLTTRRWEDSDADDPERIINSLFEGKGTLDENHELLAIEKDCFNECGRLLMEEWEAMFDRGMTSPATIVSLRVSQEDRTL